MPNHSCDNPECCNTMLSRNGTSNPDGKLNVRFEVLITEEMHESIIAMARISGIPKAEWTRSELEKLLFGQLNMVRRMTQRGQQPQPGEYTGSGQ